MLEWKTKAETRQPSIIDRPGSRESQRSHESLESQQSQESQTSQESGTTESSEYSRISSSSESKHTLALLQKKFVYIWLFCHCRWWHSSTTAPQSVTCSYRSNCGRQSQQDQPSLHDIRAPTSVTLLFPFLDRVNRADLLSDVPVDVKSLSFAAFLPTPEDCSVIHYNYSVLLGGVLVEKLSFFQEVVNQIEDFLELVITCHLVAAAMHFFSVHSVSDEPHSNGFPSNIA